MDTIFALASAQGRAGIGVIRISGPAAWDAAAALSGPLPGERTVALRRLVWQGEFLDQALVVIFERGRSFTGERVAELSVHGSTAVITAVLRALGALAGLRLAQPGEFTRRALENGCLDVAQVEGLADLIDAETEGQRKQALRVLSGAVGRKVEYWRGALIRAAALLEATIDFADEEIPQDVVPEVTALLAAVSEDLKHEISGASAAERIRDGFEVAIVGAPNAGKSTLLNALAGREAALTSEFAGTTRDVIEVRMDVRGLPVTFLDTAGLRVASDEVEQLGIRRAVERARAADLRIFLGDGIAPPEFPPDEGDLIVTGKSDLHRSATGLAVSGRTGEGLDRLLDAIAEILEDRAASAATISRERHRVAVERAYRALVGAREVLAIGIERAELAAEEIRRATGELEGLLGRIGVEDYLEEIFASFCIGK